MRHPFLKSVPELICAEFFALIAKEYPFPLLNSRPDPWRGTELKNKKEVA
jgi:hypothetical protein